MAKRSQPPPPRAANLTSEHMKNAIPKLRRRIEELKEFDVGTIIHRSDPRISAINAKIDDVLIEIFGNDTIEYGRYRIYSVDMAPMNMLYETPINEVREGIVQGIAEAKTNLETIIDLFQEKISDLGESPSGRAMRAFSSLDLHPEIECAVGKLFLDGHYANAVEDSCKVLDMLVKKRSGKHDLGGTPLMQTVFSPNSPILRFNALHTDTDKSEQQGMMYLFAGAMLALRNPRAHEIVKDDPEAALEFIAFISLLAKSLDRIERA
jgi:uncharacterized protein (TIGR02391 family)